MPTAAIVLCIFVWKILSSFPECCVSEIFGAGWNALKILILYFYFSCDCIKNKSKTALKYQSKIGSKFLVL